MAIYVVNRRDFRGSGEYVGRPSPLGNPFPMRSEADRAEVIRKYRSWLWQQLQLGPGSPVVRELLRLKQLADQGDLYLVCWCKPRQCHGDVIKGCIEWMRQARGWPA